MADVQLHYKKYGSGKDCIILLHGFGQTHLSFKSIINKLKPQYTLIAIDLYYHGNSYRPDYPLTKNQWSNELGKVLDNENIEWCHVIGFSLGGKFALASVLELEERISQTILIAPDGIHLNFWYLFATSGIGNPIFKWLMLHSARFDKWMNFFEKYRLVSKPLIRFAKKELQNPENCLRVYRSWTYFRPLQYKISALTNFFNKTNKPITIILGEKDPIIPVDRVLPKINKIRNLKTHILPVKHHQLIDSSPDLIASLLNRVKL